MNQQQQTTTNNKMKTKYTQKEVDHLAYWTISHTESQIIQYARTEMEQGEPAPEPIDFECGFEEDPDEPSWRRLFEIARRGPNAYARQ
jgi:hypothetical protein